MRAKLDTFRTHSIDTPTNKHNEADVEIAVRTRGQTSRVPWGHGRADAVKPVFDLRLIQQLLSADNLETSFHKVSTSNRKETVSRHKSKDKEELDYEGNQ